MTNKPVRNIGILAHVDAGKTTLTEQLLYASGVIRTPGRVDRGTSLTDSLEVEKRRGITVRSKSVSLDWKGTNIRIVDTPGHADFYAEVERSIRALDGAILVVSSVEGLQVQTLTIWEALREISIPTLIFVNKLDRLGSRWRELIAEMKWRFSPGVLALQDVANEASSAPLIAPITDNAEQFEDLVEHLAQLDEGLMDKYVGGEAIEWIEVEEAIKHQTLQTQVYPVLFGVALTGKGVLDVLDAIVSYLPEPSGNAGRELSAVVFQLEANSTLGRLAHVRLFDGSISQRQELHNQTLGKFEKVTRILKLTKGDTYENADELTAGDIGILCGLRLCKAGHVLGSNASLPPLSSPAEPLLTANVFLKEEGDQIQLLRALHEMEDEDPLLDVRWIEPQREINLRFFGEVQMEIVCDLLASRFNLDAGFSNPSVIYKETPLAVGEAGIKYRDGGYADLVLRVEPLPIGSGFEYEAAISGDDKIYQKFMKQIPQILERSRQRGLRGWEVTDLKVTLVDGYCKYDLGTKPDDYKIITPRVFLSALEKAGTQLLEPVVNVEIHVPSDYGTQVYRELVRMGAVFEQSQPDPDQLLFLGRAPLEESHKSTSAIVAASRGQAALKTTFGGYSPVYRQK